MRFARPVLVAVSSLVLLGAVGADATTPFGPARHVGPKSCFRLISAKGDDGTTRGYLDCVNSALYVEGSGSSWHTSSAPWTPQAVAVGGTTTYALATVGGWLSVMSRSPSGHYSTVRRLTQDDTEGVALVAHGTRWWAVWSVANGAGGFTLWEAHTLGGNQSPHRFLGTPTEAMSNVYPSLAYQPSTGMAVLAWTRGVSQGSYTAVMATSHGGAWSAPKQVDADGNGPIVVVSGGTVAIVDVHGQNQCLCYVGTFVGSTRGGFTRHVLSLPSGGRGLSADMSDGVLAVSYAADSADHSTKLLRVAEHRGGTWSESTLMTSPALDALDTQSLSGRARVFYTLHAGVLVRSQPVPVAPAPSPSARAVVSVTPTRSAAPSPTPVATTASPTPTSSPSATTSATPLAVEPTASSSGTATKVLLGIGALAVIGAGGLVLARRRRRTA